MLLSELIQDILSESGQFIIGDLECIGLDRRKFLESVVLNELKFYQRYRPLTFRFNRVANQHANGQASIFFSNQDSTGAHDGSADAGKVFSQRVGVFNRDPGMIPMWVSEVVPVNVLTTAGILYLIQETRFINVSERSILHEPRTFLWHYEHDEDHGILYTTETGRMDITAHYQYPVIDMVDSTGKLIDAELKYIDPGKDEIFLEIILGRFLVTLGRSRRAFTMNSSPINFDASELVAEGTEKEREAKERLYENSNWWQSIGT